MKKINQVSIRLVNERPLLSEEQLTSPEKVAMVVGDYIRDLDREALCVINFNSKLQPIFTIESRKFFAFGGASSHDISDGILCPDNWKEKAKELERQGKYGFRVKDISWWKEELPTEEEMKHGMDVLKRNNTELGRFSEMVTENYLFQTADMWFEAGKKEGHAYELEVIWPEDKKDVLWADVPDLVKIQVHMEQAETTASTFVVPVLARYHHSSTRIWEIASVPFYFTSDRLTEEGKEYQLSPETEALSIELRNDQDGNRWSDTPIHYIYQVKKDGEEQEEKGGEGILYPQQGAGSSERIVIQDMTPGVYDIEVQSQSPFEKTLKGTFIIPEKENDIFCVKEDRQGSFCVQLTVSVKDYEGNIKIFWPEGLIPDSTQAVFEDVKTRTEDLYEAGELTLWMEPYTSRTFRFFKTDAETDYTWDTKLNAEAAD